MIESISNQSHSVEESIFLAVLLERAYGSATTWLQCSPSARARDDDAVRRGTRNNTIRRWTLTRPPLSPQRQLGRGPLSSRINGIRVGVQPSPSKRTQLPLVARVIVPMSTRQRSDQR